MDKALDYLDYNNNTNGRHMQELCLGCLRTNFKTVTGDHSDTPSRVAAKSQVIIPRSRLDC
jgi:hypothetical protein